MDQATFPLEQVRDDSGKVVGFVIDFGAVCDYFKFQPRDVLTDLAHMKLFVSSIRVDMQQPDVAESRSDD